MLECSRGETHPNRRANFPEVEITPDLTEEDCIGHIMHKLGEDSMVLGSMNKKNEINALCLVKVFNKRLLDL